MELIVQKAVELGVYEIIPVAAKRAVVKLDEKKRNIKGNAGRELPKQRQNRAGERRFRP